MGSHHPLLRMAKLRLCSILDTDVLIDAGRAVEVAIVQLEVAAESSTLAVSTITQMDSLSGAAIEQITDFWSGF